MLELGVRRSTSARATQSVHRARSGARRSPCQSNGKIRRRALAGTRSRLRQRRPGPHECRPRHEGRSCSLSRGPRPTTRERSSSVDRSQSGGRGPARRLRSARADVEGSKETRCDRSRSRRGRVEAQGGRGAEGRGGRGRQAARASSGGRDALRGSEGVARSSRRHLASDLRLTLDTGETPGPPKPQERR